MNKPKNNQIKQPYDQSPQKKSRTLLWILGWLCIFPLPLTIILLRKKNMKTAIKFGIIGAAWVLYLLIGLLGGSHNSTEQTISAIGDTSIAEDIEGDESPAEVIEHSTETEISGAEDVSEEAESGVTDIEVEAQDEMTVLQSFYDDFRKNGSLKNIREISEQYGLFIDSRRDGIGNETYKVAYTKDLAKVISNADLKTPGNYVVIEFNLLDDTITEIRLHTDADESQDTDSNGRYAYIGKTGYITVNSTQKYDLEKEEAYLKTPWLVPTYEKTDYSYKESGTVEHKTEVTVKEEDIEHTGHGFYDGFLYVERTDNHDLFYIDMDNFITSPYWIPENITPEHMGFMIAEYNQKSGHLPVTGRGDSLEEVDIPNGTKVFVQGAGTDLEYHPVIAKVYKEWRNGYGGVDVCFNFDDLTMLY